MESKYTKQKKNKKNLSLPWNSCRMKIIGIVLFMFFWSLTQISAQNIATNYDSITIDSTNFNQYFNLAKDLKNKFLYKKAFRITEKLCRFDSVNVDLLILKGDMYDDINASKKAIQYYDKALAVDTFNLSALLKLGNLYMMLKDYTTAMGYFFPVLNYIDSLNYFALKQIGYSYLSMGDQVAVFGFPYLVKAYDVNPYDLSLIIQIGNFLNKSRKFDETLLYCDRGLQYDSLNSKILNLKGYTLYNKNDYPAAIGCFEKVLQQEDTSAFTLQNLGYAYYRDGQMMKARKLLELSLVFDTAEYEPYIILGDIYLQQKQPDKSLKYFNKADSLKYPPSITQTTIYRGMSDAFTQKRDWDDAVFYLTRACETKPKDMSLLFRLGNYYEYMKLNEKAYQAYSQVISSNDTANYRQEINASAIRLKRLNEELFFDGKKQK